MLENDLYDPTDRAIEFWAITFKEFHRFAKEKGWSLPDNFPSPPMQKNENAHEKRCRIVREKGLDRQIEVKLFAGEKMETVSIWLMKAYEGKAVEKNDRSTETWVKVVREFTPPELKAKAKRHGGSGI